MKLTNILAIIFIGLIVYLGYFLTHKDNFVFTWHTFYSVEKNFSIKYPNSYRIQVVGDVNSNPYIIFFDTNQKSFKEIINGSGYKLTVRNTTQKDINDYIKDYLTTGNIQTNSISDTKISNLSAKKIIYKTSKIDTSIIFIGGPNVYHFDYANSNLTGKELETKRLLQEKIAQTLKIN